MKGGGKMTTIGLRIKQLREEKGMSVSELARRVGKNRATIYRYENGEIETAPYTILAPLAKALNTTPTYLMGIEDTPKNHIEEIKQLGLETDELQELVNYANYIVSKRK